MSTSPSECNQKGKCACCGIDISAHLDIQLQYCLAWCSGYVKVVRESREITH